MTHRGTEHMRNPDGIPVVLSALKRVWRKVPDWRLCQLIVNITSSDPFYVEDDKFLEKLLALEKDIERTEKNT
jgi:hypothetical protein